MMSLSTIPLPTFLFELELGEFEEKVYKLYK